jgi:hypothetical protein
MTQIDEEQEKQPANELASASPSNSALNAADPEDPNLPAPIVPLAPGGVLLEPNRADPDGLAVEVTYPSMSVHDTIALTFNGENTLVPQDGNGDLKVTFLVPKEYVAKTVGKTVQVFYRVTTNAGAVRSQTLNLDVKLIPLDKLLAPKILQAEGNVLDVGGLPTYADIFVNAWPLIALKQKMWMRLKGSGNLDLPVWEGDEIVSTKAQVATVGRSDLQNLTDGSQLNLVLEVSFNDGPQRQPFPMRTYQIKTAPEFALGALELVGATGGVIDLGVVSGDPVTVHTHAYIGQTAGDRLLLSWAGVAADGTPITFSREYTVQAGGETGEVQFEVPRANLESLGGGTLQLSYQIIKVGGGIQNSPVTVYSVVAKDNVDQENFEGYPPAPFTDKFETDELRFEVSQGFQWPLRHSIELFEGSKVLSAQGTSREPIYMYFKKTNPSYVSFYIVSGNCEISCHSSESPPPRFHSGRGTLEFSYTNISGFTFKHTGSGEILSLGLDDIKWS